MTNTIYQEQWKLASGLRNVLGCK